jgi:hypothetical protein
MPRHVARLVTRLIALPVVDYSASRRLVFDYFAPAARSSASARRAARHAARRAARHRLLRLAQAHRRLLRLAQARRRLLRLRSRVGVPRHVARLVTRLVAPLIVDYSASRRLIVDYFASAARPGASARRAARHTARRAARCRLLRLYRASGCLGTSRGSSHGSSRRSTSTTPPSIGSSSTTSPPPCVRMPRLVMRLVAPPVVDYSALRRLVIDYSASRWLVVDHFTSAVRPGASACRAARHAARRRLLRLTQAHRRLLHLRRMSGCLGTSRGSSRGSSRHSLSNTPPRVSSSSTTSPTPCVWVPLHVARLVTRLVAPVVIDYSASRMLVVDYFASAAPPGASERRAARHAARRTTRRRLLRVVQARRRLLRLCRASGCLVTLRCSSRGSSRR